MLYYPKSYITPNLYSNGELTYANSSTSYTGYYFSTIDNKLYSGRFPGDGDNQELTSLNTSNISLSVEEFESSNPEDSRFYPENFTYSELKKVKYNQGLTPPPNQYYPKPSEQVYEIGEFQRYFAKKTNEHVFYETATLVNNKYYIGISLPWKIKGDKDVVYNTNKNIVELKEQQLQISGLGAYLNFNYLEFYK